MTIQEQLRNIATQKGISNYRIAKDTGINEGQLNKFFNYKVNLSLKKILEIAEYLNCELIITPKDA